jgi:hypothetical protein
MISTWLLPSALPPQLLVERYFSSQLLLRSYWLGIFRPDPLAAFAYVDGSEVPALPNEDPYGHWAVQHMAAFTKNSSAVGDCAVANASAAYDRFAGDSTNSSHWLLPAHYQTNGSLTGDRKYGWAAQPCSSTFAYICQTPASAFPCYPPPTPPPPPPLPPSPPSPPLPPTCAPVASRHIFCDSAVPTCYAYNRTMLLTFSQATRSCEARGGKLLSFPGPSLDKQLKVESYFTASGAMLNNSRYWHGAVRDADTGDIALTDGTALLPIPAATSEYHPHWSWRFPASLLAPDSLCAVASSNTTFWTFLGNASDSSALEDPAAYVTNASNRERTFGWELASCSLLLPHVCEVPLESFPCAPPPLPPPLPPQPPPPPSPPAPESCECCCQCCCVKVPPSGATLLSPVSAASHSVYVCNYCCIRSRGDPRTAARSGHAKEWPICLPTSGLSSTNVQHIISKASR